MSGFFKNIRGDKVLWVVVVILSIFSLLAVYSSTGTLAYRKQGGNTEYYLLKHFIIVCFGFVLMVLVHRIRHTYFSRISQVALIIAVILLIVTLFFGSTINDASRSIMVPFLNLTFQSSDFAKLALIMYTARILSKKQDQIKDFKTAFLPIMWPILLVCALILPENFSTAAMLFGTCLVLMFIGRVNIRYIFSLIGTGMLTLAVVIALVMITKPDQGRVHTWKNRIDAFMNGEPGSEGYQVEQSKIAIATGGVFGKMPGKSTQRNFLPHPYSDFIYAIIIEEYGFIGGILLVLLYLIILFRGTRIVVKSPGNFGAFLAIGVSFSLVFQAMINMAVAVNLFPVTGQPLPLVSMGGTSIWFTSIAIGIILSVSREIENPKPASLEDGTPQA
ncbi:MAG TPA: putative peptidoglycan glycosyltransferase FtsW [Bacteroidales bacterium]|nr:putative peptidoglycan glycosyltransferase FtsW [Bacteroidales bacterium]HSA44385.1 putative peptidoglycan glycosyltransferase FtsW [Bacteroidales bacterium]